MSAVGCSMDLVDEPESDVGVVATVNNIHDTSMCSASKLFELARRDDWSTLQVNAPHTINGQKILITTPISKE
jgi:hypothetical protein